MVKRILAILLGIVLALNLAACGLIPSPDGRSGTESSQPSSAKPSSQSSRPVEESSEPVSPTLAEDGGTVESDTGVSVRFTPGLNVPDESELKVVKMETAEDEEIGASYTAYDISMGGVHDLGGYVDIRIPYSEEGIEPGEDPAKCVAGMYLDEETGEWEGVLYKVDTKAKELVISTDHFSTYGCFVFKNEGKRSARVTDVHEWMLSVDESQCAKALQEIIDNNGEPGVECRELMRPVLEDTFGALSENIGKVDDKATVTNTLATLFINGSLLGDAVGNSEWANGITTALSYAGIATAVANLSVQALKENKTDNEIKGMYKSAVYLLGSLSQDATLGVIGASVWLIDKGLTDMGEYAYTKVAEDTSKAYRRYYSKYMVRSKTDWRWKFKDIARSAIKNEKNASTAIMDEIDRWCNLFWECDSDTYTNVLTDVGQTGRGLPDADTKKAITAEYKGILLKQLEPVLEEVQRDLEQDLWREQMKRIDKFIAKINSVLTFEIREETKEGQKPALAGYTVAFHPLTKGAVKQDWRFTMPQSGSMKVECTFIAYQMVGPPREIELYAPGKDPDKDLPDRTVEFRLTAPKTVITIASKQEEWVDAYKYFKVKDIIELYPKLRSDDVLKLKVTPVAFNNNNSEQVTLTTGGDPFIIDLAKGAVTTYNATYSVGSLSYDLTMTFTSDRSSDLFRVDSAFTETSGSHSESEAAEDCIIFNYQVDTFPAFARKGIIIDNHTTASISFVVNEVLLLK